MHYDDEAFVALVNDRGVKMRAVAAAMGMTPATLYRKRKGVFDFSRTEIQRCCEFFGLSDMNYIFFASEVS